MLTLLVYIFGSLFYGIACAAVLTTWSYYLTEDNSKNKLKLGLSVLGGAIALVGMFGLVYS